MSSIKPPSKEAVSTALAAVSEIDLSPINRKLKFEDPEYWTDSLLADAETNYRRFLTLNVLYPSQSHVVNEIIDDYWHQHILDTRKYADDCQKLFGSFLHHYPYFGIEGEEDKQRNLEGFEQTKQLWQETFGDSLTGERTLTLDRVLGTYQTEPTESTGDRIFAFPKSCKCGQHCNRAILPHPDVAIINPPMNVPRVDFPIPQITPNINPQTPGGAPPTR